MIAPTIGQYDKQKKNDLDEAVNIVALTHYRKISAKSKIRCVYMCVCGGGGLY